MVSPVGRAPDALRTPPTTCTIDGWCGSLGDYAAIWGSSLSDIWVAANNVKNDDPSSLNAPEAPVLLHWDGVEWSTVELGDAQQVKLVSIWGSSAADVWVAGDSGYVAHFDGRSWLRSQLPIETPPGLSAVGGSGRTDVWAVGSGVSHFDGRAWSLIEDGTNGAMSSVWSAPGEVWTVRAGLPRRSRDGGRSWHAAAPEPEPPTYSWNAVWGHRAGGPFLAGKAGALGRWTEPGWVVQTVGDADDAFNFVALAGLGAEDVWAVGDRGVLAHWNGRSWAQHPSPTIEPLHGVWGADGRFFAVGDHGTFLELVDGQWTGNHPGVDIHAIWGGAPNDVWAVGSGATHWDGVNWSQVPELQGTELSGIWGSSSQDVWVVGKRGAVLHYDGMLWADVVSPTMANLTGVWGSRRDDVWAVDDAGKIAHFDGNAWRLWPADDFGPLAAIYGTGESDVVVAGETSRAHFDGFSWTRLPDHPRERAEYFTAFGDATNVFVGGLVRWNGYKAGGAHPELGRWHDGSFFDDLEPLISGSGVVRAGWASGELDVWIALPQLMHHTASGWTRAGTSQSHEHPIDVSALGATSEDIWAAVIGAQILRKRRN